MNNDDARYKLLDWVAEYSIEEEIKDILADRGLTGAEAFLRTFFDGQGEAEWLAAYFTER